MMFGREALPPPAKLAKIVAAQKEVRDEPPGVVPAPQEHNGTLKFRDFRVLADGVTPVGVPGDPSAVPLIPNLEELFKGSEKRFNMLSLIGRSGCGKTSTTGSST